MPSNEHQRILAVDDNEATRYMVARTLRRAGYLVDEATTGTEALRRVESQPDLVVLDVRLPDLNGLEVCRRIKSDPSTRHIPVLHLSASFTEGADKAHGLDGGADGYLTHPVEAPELLANVRSLLRARDAEARARTAAREWQATFDAIGDGVCLVDGAGVILRANLALARLVGRPISRVAGATFVPLLRDGLGEIGELDAAGLARMLRETDLAARELRLGRRWFRVSASPVMDGLARPATVCVVEEVTDRHRYEMVQRYFLDASNALAASLDQRATLAAVARLAVPFLADACVVDVVEESDGPLRRAEVAQELAAEGAGATLVEALRSGAAVDARDPDAPLERVRRTGEALLVEGGVEQVLHAVAPRVDARLATLSFAPRAALLVPLVARGRTLGVVSFLAAASDRYDPEARAVAHELARRAALAADNARLYEIALAANQAKADFLAVMSHELRTPLNAILGYADLMEYGIAGPVTDRQSEQLGRIKLSGRHLLALIDEVLTFSRIEAGKEALSVEETDVGRLVQESASLVEPLVAAKRLELDVRAPEAPTLARTDARKLRQILVNLLSNAVKFTDSGTITLATVVEPARVVMTVRDTGIGIPPQHLEHIFDPFWQVEQTALTRRSGGTGLGLSVVRRLARLLGGDVDVTSTMGAGSEFTVWIPRALEVAVEESRAG